MSFVDRFSFFRRSDPVGYRFRKDSCLDYIDEANSCVSSGTGRKKQCYSVPACEHNKRRATIVSASPASSLVEISKSGSSGSNKFLSFLHKGFHGHKSKSGSKSEKDKIRSSQSTEISNLQDLIPIPIRETAIQGHSKTLFHKVPNSNLRAKPLIILAQDTKIVPVHASILSNRCSHCVKILSISPNVYRESGGNKYELMLPTGTMSLGHTCRIMADEDGREKYRSCHSSQLSLFSAEQIRKPTVGYIFSCASAFEQKKWINVLTRIARPNQQNERRKEISLNLWIQEAKNVPAKKRYFCEIYLDGTLYARTTTKMMSDMLFWGEEFNLCNLDDVNVVVLLLWKCADEGRSKKKKSQQQLICQINISSKEIDQRTSVEKWYSGSSNYNPSSPDTPTANINQGILSSSNTAFVPISQSVQITSLVNSSTTLSSGDQVPMLRVKARYQHLDVLPLSAYSDMIKFLNDNTVRTLTEIEPYLKVKAKEDLAQNLIKIIHKQGTAVPILCDLIINEINKSDDKNLILRGNTMASKAMEIYLKLIGEKYLQLTLSDFINRVLLNLDDCEVDPQKDKFDYYGGSTPTGHSSPGVDKGTPQYTLQQRQESLLMNVDMIWAKIMSSSIYFPKDLKTVFVTLRHRLQGSRQGQLYCQTDDQPDLCDRIISACIFLRYICPAILTPSLFGLIPEYPDNPKVTRTFTLVAKCIQTLANFSNLSGTKETYMVFMNHFIEGNFKTMRDFLREISGNHESESGRKDSKAEVPPSSLSSTDSREYLYWENLSTNLPEDTIDMALCLATLHRQMEDCLQMISPQNVSGNIKNLQTIIRDINIKLKLEEGIVPPIKISHSYQNIRSQPQTQQEYPKRTSLDAPDYSTKIIPNETREQKGHNTNCKPKHPKATFSRIASNSHSAESTPTHHPPEKALATPDYLMTQSMMENNLSGSKTSKGTQPSCQVDKEWKAMLSASYAYSNKSGELFFAGPITSESEIKSSTSSGYQTLSRSTDSIEKTAEDILVLPKSPTASVKPSVKKCKQARRQTDLIPRPDPLNLSQQCNAKTKIKEPPSRSVSTEEIRQLLTQNSLNHYDDQLDSSSTQTLIATNISKSETQPVTEEKFKLTNSISMPVVSSLFDIESNRTADFYSAFQGLPNNENNSDVSFKPSNSDGMGGLSNGRSAFRDATKFRPPNQVVKSNQDPLMMMNDTEKIKYSLNNLRQTLNSRMKQLLLADRTTIQLELERVKLMRRICDTSSTNGTTLANNFILFSGRELQNMHIINGHGSTPICHPKANKTISIKKYLDLAENVLSDALNNHIKADRGQISVADMEMEDLLVQIFQTNQNLQNTLMSKCEKPNCPEAKHHIDDQNSFNNRKNQPLYRIHRSINNKPPASSMTTTNNTKSNSLGSLTTNPSQSSAMIEIVDAV